MGRYALSIQFLGGAALSSILGAGTCLSLQLGTFHKFHTTHFVTFMMLQRGIELTDLHNYDAALHVNCSNIRRHHSFYSLVRLVHFSRPHRHKRRCASGRRAAATRALPAQAASCCFAAATVYVAPFYAAVEACLTAWASVVVAITLPAWLQLSRAGELIIAAHVDSL